MPKIVIGPDTTDEERLAIAEQLPHFNAETAPNWHYTLSDGRIFSVAQIAFVTEDDPDYNAWLEDGNLPTPYPGVERLQETLDAFNLSASLPHYIRARTWAMRVAGVTVGDITVPTDADTLSLLNGLKGLAEQDPNGEFPFDDGSPEGRVLTAEQAIGLATAVGQAVQSTFTKRIATLKAYAAGDLGSKADVDKALAPPKARASAKKTAR